ncbi:MAG: choice-of-anchor B family protein [Saprospiraceae bacterium]|nr:choice-of-anchor B family protein [Saprospiraceae bacterium]
MKIAALLCILFCLQIAESRCQAKQLKLLGHWRDSNVLGSSAYDNAFNEAWGFWVNGKEYGVIGSTSGTHLIDVTNPSKLFERMLIPGASNGPHVIHRDYDDYRCYLYAVCDEGQSSLQIIDISQLPDTATIVYDSNEFMTRVHNIFIDIPKARLYTCSENGNTGFFALGLYDISNPIKPKFIGHYNKFGDITASHVHDAYARNDTVYLNCGPNGFAIMDFSDAINPKPILTLTPADYPFAGYNHSGWLTPDGLSYVMADENHGLPLKLIDLTDIKNGKVVSTLSPAKDTAKSIPHNPLVSCDYAYVSYYYDGLQVYNIKNPAKPILEAFYPTSILPNNLSYKGSWGNYPYLPSGNIVIADMQNGLFVVEGVEKPCNVVYSCNPVATNSFDKSLRVNIFPNPTQHGIQIKTPFLYHAATFEISDITGKLLKKGIIQSIESNNTIPLDELESGYYILKLRFKNQGLFTSSLIKF